MLPVKFEAELTAREREVLELVANGYSAKSIGVRLEIAPRTVERHIENLRLKMRARNRAHMVTLAVLSGVLKIGPAPDEPRLCAECLFRPSQSDEDPARIISYPLPGSSGRESDRRGDRRSPEGVEPSVHAPPMPKWPA